MDKKITDLNVTQVPCKDKHFKEFKISYKYNDKSISDFKMFDKALCKDKTDKQLKNMVEKQVNADLNSGRLVKYARRYTGFTAMVTTVSVVGGLIAATAVAVPVTLHVMNMNNASSNGIKFSTENTINLDESRTKAVLNLDWKPADHSIECSDFTFVLEKQSSVTYKIESEEAGSRPLKLTITFDKELEEDKGTLNFRYNDKTAKKEGKGKVKNIGIKLPEPEEKAFFSIDVDTYGTLSYGEQTGVTKVDISDALGKKGVEITFVPKPEYTDRIIEFTLTNTEEFKLDFKDNVIVIEGIDTRTFQDGDDLTATVDLAEEVGDCFGFENASNGNKEVNITLTPSATATTNPEVYYTLQNPANSDGWTQWDYTSGNAISLKAGKAVYFKGNNPNGFSTENCHYTFGTAEGYDEDIKIIGHGNIMSLIDDGACSTAAIPNDYCFAYLFQYFKRLELDDDFVLSATTLTSKCYSHMFEMNTSIFSAQPSILTHAPNLPAAHLYPHCYEYMFSFASIVNPPIIGATTLVSVGAGPQEQSVGSQCAYMFQRCPLTSTPDLSNITGYSTPDFTISSYNFTYMYAGCSALVEVPKNSFPTFSEKVNYGTFDAMFQSCMNLEKVDFSNVTVTNESMCTYTFSGCSKLSELTVGFGTPGEDTWPLGEECGWLSNVASTGIFKWKGANTGITWTRDGNHVPSGWTIQTIA